MGTRPLATIWALRDWLGLGSDFDHTRALAALNAASAVVRDEAGQTWIDDDGELEDVPEVIAGVTVRLAARLWSNPSSVTQQTSGPFSTTFARTLLTGDDLRILSRKGSYPGLWTLGTTREALETQDLVPVVGSDEPLPVSRDPW